MTTFTEYAKSKIEDYSIYNIPYPNDGFWLRNQGRSGEEDTIKYSAAMYAKDTIDFKGAYYDYRDISCEDGIKYNLKLGFRPAIWVKLDNN